MLALGLDQAEAGAFLPTQVVMQLAEHIATWFPAFSADSRLAGVAPADVHNRDPRTLPLVVGGATAYGDGVLAATGNVVFCQLAPYQATEALNSEPFNRRRTFVRASFTVNRLLGNLGVSGSTPLLERFGDPVGASKGTSAADVRLEPIQDPTVGRWLDGLYLPRPAEWDDPYRFFRW